MHIYQNSLLFIIITILAITCISKFKSLCEIFYAKEKNELNEISLMKKRLRDSKNDIEKMQKG